MKPATVLSGEVVARRAIRGAAPPPIRLADFGPAVLALGGYLKSTVCVTRADEAFVSQPVGDLDDPACCLALEEAVDQLLHALQVRPALVAHDLHPDFYSTRFAMAYAKRAGLPAIAIQHHHAHVAAIAAEHGLRTPLLGLALDGVGLGTDGGIWGGELLRVQAGAAARIGHLRQLKLPGGDRAAREPWRMAASALFEMGRANEITARFAGRSGAILTQMLSRGLNSPPTSSAGRWFDAAAGLLGICPVSSYEGQAAMLLERMAKTHGAVPAMQEGYRIGTDDTLDLLPLLAHLAEIEDAAYGAALFHSTFACALADWVCAAGEETGLGSIALGGGCFMNRILCADLRQRLEAAGFSVFEAQRLPPNDGGLALGQAAAAVSKARA